MRFPTNRICAKNNNHIYVVRKSNNRVILSGNLYCCLLPQCDALHTYRSSFPIATKWCCDQDVKVVPGSVFIKKNVRSVQFVVKMRGCCCNLSFGVVLNVWFTTNGMCTKNNTHTYCMWHEQAIRMIMACDLYCCLLPQCEALRTCCSGFPIATLAVSATSIGQGQFCLSDKPHKSIKHPHPWCVLSMKIWCVALPWQ